MATRSVKTVSNPDGTMTATWEGITENDTGAAADLSRFPDKTVQVIGDFTSSGAITIEGSNDGLTYGVCHDPTGATLVLTDSIPKLIVENTKYIRPRATAGSSVDMDVLIHGAPR